MRIYYTAYITTNLVNGKEYIGVHKTKNLNDSYLGSGSILKQAIKKYGHGAFNKKIIALFDSEDHMFTWEAENVTQEIVDDPMFYNCRVGGLGGNPGGYTLSENTKNKMRLSKQNISDETRAKISVRNKGKIMSKETRAKIGAANTGKKHSIETRIKMSVAHVGNFRSIETRAKMSMAHHNRAPVSDETRAKMSAKLKGRKGTNTGKKFSDETRAKMSASAKNKPPMTDVTKAKMSASAKNKPPMTDVTKAKISAAKKKKVK